MKPAHGRVWRLRRRLGSREARGSAAVDHLVQAIETATDITVYFVLAHLPWERETNESAGGLLREYCRKAPILPATPAI
jgi:IS30 family transposase